MSSLRQCKYAVRGQNHSSASDFEWVKRIRRYLVGRPRSECLFHWQQRGELEVYSDADWGGDKDTRRSVSAGVVMRGGHQCLLYAALVRSSSEGLGIQNVSKDLGCVCGLNLHLDATATMCLVNRRGLGKAKHVDMHNLWIQEASKLKRFDTKKVGTNVNPADLMTKPGPKIVQPVKIMGSIWRRRDTFHKTGELTATCRVKCDRGLFAVGYCTP